MGKNFETAIADFKIPWVDCKIFLNLEYFFLKNDRFQISEK